MLHVAVGMTQKKMFNESLQNGSVDADCFQDTCASTISTRGRVTQDSFTSLLSSKRSPDCRIALFWYNMGLGECICSQIPTNNYPNVAFITK